MRFADELRGSEGERCSVILNCVAETRYEGVIQKWYDRPQMADVLTDEGTVLRVGFAAITLLGEERAP